MPEFRIPSWSARNPLGIIALFISLIYGMSALLLGTTVKNLLPENQTILVYFVVVFPFVVLSVFGWLVSRHHKKLYGPADYRTDKGFLDAGDTVPAVEVGKKLADELAIDAPETNAEQQVDPQETLPVQASVADAVSRLSIDRSSQLKEAYLAEGLVFQALQSELGGSVRREVVISGLHVDGLIYSSDGIATIVEVKIISGSQNWERRIREAGQHLTRARAALKEEKNVRLILAIVVKGNSGRVAEFKQRLPPRSDFEVRLYGLSELIARYGFGET
jgi:hypothetical protein